MEFNTQLFDNSGKLVYEKSEVCYFCESTLKLTADVREKNLPNGVYFLRIEANNQGRNTQSRASAKVIFWK